MSWKKFLSDYFTFSRKDRVGILALICLILFIGLIPHFYSKPTEHSLLKVEPTLLEAIKSKPSRDIPVQEIGKEHFAGTPASYEKSHKELRSQSSVLFPFDPNTLNDEGWKSLGLPIRTIKTINNYRSGGGKFYKREDFKKIWGLPKGFYEQVEPYIEISTIHTPIYTNNLSREKRERSIFTIDINKADTTAFIALPGIGSKLANRIVNFRDKLGGFHSIDQIGETYGLPDSTFQKLKVYFQISTTQVRTLNINTVTKDELKVHPYIRWSLANAIVEYRNQHGNFKSLGELKKITLLDDTTYNKILPYLNLE